NELLNKPNTAHTLGGCGIGANDREGVVDKYQRVFNYPGLMIADASVIPANLGVNPSLTITAMAERAMQHVPQKAAAPPIAPLQAPLGLELLERGKNGRVPTRILPLLLGIVPLLLLLFRAVKRKA
ncbi:MAG: hypothetical protein KC425_12410, partial [Anaerolineales bacterium]|nr:hypothetical protein [Anaerolineales bacterium]